MEFVRIDLDKSANSDITGDKFSIYVENDYHEKYIKLLMKTFPRTSISRINKYVDAQKRSA